MSKHLVELFSFLEPVCCGIVLLALYRSRQARSFGALTALMWTRLVGDLFCLALLEAAGRALSPTMSYRLYFYLYWFCYSAESLLSLYVIVGIFKLAMAPLRGLRTLGMLVFRWAAAISIALAVAIGFTPNQSGARFLVSAVTHLQQISCVLTLCLLLFVCFAIRPLGLSLRSRIFGVALGLGLVSGIDLISAAWIAHAPQMYSIPSAFTGAFGIVACGIWAVYFFAPEPKRRIIVLPTTSPFLRWNQISEVLGDEPGFVAIAGVPPEIFAPAELEIMARASAKMERSGTSRDEFSFHTNNRDLSETELGLSSSDLGLSAALTA